ncbi:MAG TPA: hypothetical protein GXZ39_01795 [Bacteroidales bacterium]|nr:hypothetical protein [Bacteroidales bacterium]
MLPEEGLSRSLELLARELSLQQIAHISQNTRVPLEKHLHRVLNWKHPRVLKKS